MSKADGYVADADAAGEKELGDLERVVTAPQLPGAGGGGDEKDGDVVRVETAASQRLPFSKARCVALVFTIAAAPFLSVSTKDFYLVLRRLSEG